MGSLIGLILLMGLVTKNAILLVDGALQHVREGDEPLVAIRKAGGKPLMWKTGHSLAKEKLRQTRAPFAGEMSGHFFFKERWYGFDDATYTAARLLEILSRSRDPSKVLKPFWASSTTLGWASKAARSAPSTACVPTIRTASASSAPATPRRCWCCVSRATPRLR